MKTYNEAERVGEIAHANIQMLLDTSCDGVLIETFICNPIYGKKRYWICNVCGAELDDNQLREISDDIDGDAAIDAYQHTHDRLMEYFRL